MTTQTPTNVPPISDWNRLLDGRFAVVSGGGDGIGAAVARLFAEHGALVEIAEIDRDRASTARASIEAAGGNVRAHVLDVTEDDAVATFSQDVLAAHGRVDIVVNNVG